MHRFAPGALPIDTQTPLVSRRWVTRQQPTRLPGDHVYITQVPTYVYALPCGPDHRHRSMTPSQPDEWDVHWLYCRRCADYRGIHAAELVEYRPRSPGARTRVWGDGELARRADRAILKDRVRALLRDTWNTVPAAMVARQLQVPLSLVQAVSEDMGIYRSPLF